MDTYKNNIERYKIVSGQLSDHLKKVSALRLSIFLFTLILIVFLANERLFWPLIFVIPVCIVVFVAVVRRYYLILSKKQHIDFLLEINEKEVSRQKNELLDFPDGSKFLKRDHPYVSDLDIFGKHSLLQLLNRTTTESGLALLVHWLSEPASKAEILERQTTVRELVPKTDWRQDFQASGMKFTNEKSDYKKLISWIEKPPQLLPVKSKYLIVSVLLSLISTSAAAYFLYGLLSEAAFSIQYVIPVAVSLFINRRVLKIIRPISEEIIDSTHVNIKTLRGYQALIIKIEKEEFSSIFLKRQKAVLKQGTYSASEEINRLRRILEMFQSKGTKGSVGKNDFYGIFNSLWFFDIYLIIMTENWKDRNKPYLSSWADAVSKFEVLSSLAGFAYSNDTFSFPEITEEPFIIDFNEMSHPLIFKDRRVYNDFNLHGRGEIALITGSNMAGKSTFLRSVGVNLVLALMGAPCCALKGRVSQMKMFTSMRTQDNLEEGISSFYAELKRIEKLLKLSENEAPVFFLLDEMFKGTNSEDRYAGGASLIKQLSEQNTFGIISTHDLELAKLTVNQKSVTNFSFNSKIENGEIVFNYGLTPGICSDFNARELMKKSGIDILPDLDGIL